jgi:formylglycine-generating enzyme required for sulfatase activity
LDHVHGLGLVHRDVKPENIFFDARWGAFLGDFGVAKIVEESAAFSRDQTLTATSMAIGTQQYMAPEQFQPKADVDGRTDQYALAVTVYEVLCGERPFRGETSNLIVEIMTTPAPSLAARHPKLPPSLVAAVQRGLSKQPGERFGSCQGFVDAVLGDVKELPDESEIARLMCPNCGNILKLRPDAAGRKGSCPKCRVQMRVARDLEALWVVGEDGGQTALETGSSSAGTSKSGGVFKTISGGVAAWPWRGGIEVALGSLVAGPRWVLAMSVLVAGVFGIGATATILAWVFSHAQPTGRVADGIQAPTGTVPPVAEISIETAEPPPAPLPPAPLPPAPLPPAVAVTGPLVEARATLERDPQDHVANGVVGRMLCFEQERWDEGLEHLTQCDTPALATIARNEIAARTQPAEALPGDLLRIAKAWWDLHQGGFLPKADSEAVGRHSVDLYGQIVAKLSQDRDVIAANEWLDRDDTFRRAVNNVRPRPSPAVPLGMEIVAQPSLVNSIGIKLRLIPAGTFQMGLENGDPAEKPVHEVRITKPFYLGVTEVTNAQWQTVMGTEPPSKWKDADRPVETVSWTAAVGFCRMLSERPEERDAGRVYRLPTEAEWEYACRAGTTTTWASGDDENTLGEFAWFGNNSGRDLLDANQIWVADSLNYASRLTGNGNKTHAVGQKWPNAWGLHDMHGNVWEWCSNRYGTYAADTVADPTGPSAGSYRVSRGGGWRDPSGDCRATIRFKLLPSYRDDSLGFRLALSPSESTPPAGSQAATEPGRGEAEPMTERVAARATEPSLGNAAAAEILARPPAENSIGMKLKLIPPGTFLMGSNDGDPDEMPVHEVKITKPFHVGVYEVTNAQWQAVMGKVPSAWRGDDHPVEQVSWTDAIAFCRTLTALPAERAAGRVYRLPTEAEWEYACRAGTKSEFSFGGDRSLLADYGWFSGNSGGQTRPVGLKKPNPWGLYDMHGNVWEWCSDGYGPFTEEVSADPRGLATAAVKVYRGGNWGYMARESRSAKRKSIDPEHRDHYRGFRVVMDEHQQR